MLQILAALAACASLAETVPQDSADKYCFTRPNLPSNIEGRVVGSPAAYSVMRSEDWAWLYEAYCERYALMTGKLEPNAAVREVAQTGEWPLSETNRFMRWTTAAKWVNGNLATNIVCGWSRVTNVWLMGGIDAARTGLMSWSMPTDLANWDNTIDGYIATDDAVLADTNSIPFLTPPVMNVTVSVTTNWQGISMTSMTSVVRQPWTNGTETVFSNWWDKTLPVERIEMNTVVSHYEYYTLCFTNLFTVPGYHPASFRAVDWIYNRAPISASDVTNAYAYLSGARRIFRVVTESQPSNGWAVVKTYWSSSGGGSINVHTNRMFTNLPAWTSSRDWSSGEEERPAYDEIRLELRCAGHDGYPDYPLMWHVAHAGGINRIGRATLYMAGSSRWEWRRMEGEGDEFHDVGESSSHAFAMKLGTAQEEPPDEAGYCVFSFTMPMSAYEDALALNGGKSFPAVGTYQTRDTDDGYEVSPVEFYLVIDLAPYASLPGWNGEGEEEER